MKKIMILLCLMLVGCGVDDNNHGYGYEIDGVTPLGIEYRNDNQEQSLTSEMIDQIYIETEQCSEMFYKPNNLMIITNNTIDRPGYYYHSPDLIVIQKKYGLRHEFLHYLLNKTRGYTSSADHGTPVFTDCGDSPLNIIDWLNNILEEINTQSD